MYFILQKTLSMAYFEDMMLLFQRIIDICSQKGAVPCLDIGDKNHSRFEADRIFNCFYAVFHEQTIYLIRSALYLASDWKTILISGSIDGWSRGMFVHYNQLLHILFVLLLQK